MERLDGLLLKFFLRSGSHVFLLDFHDDQLRCPANENSQENNEKYNYYDYRYHLCFCSPLLSAPREGYLIPVSDQLIAVSH